MSFDLGISQVLVAADASGPAVVARSADVAFAWEDMAVTTAARFGRRPAGVRCPAAVFAAPVGRTHIAVVQVADQPGSPGIDPPLGFRFLILGKPLYEALGDPFAIADRYPPDWAARGTLETLAWPPEPLPYRTVEQVQIALKTGDTPLLLGGAQALLDGGRVVLRSDTPSIDLFRKMWLLLPSRTRCELWPATFAFSVELGFHAAVLPVVPDPWPVGTLTADQCRDYPEGRYELALQVAAEAGNQAELDRLFARRSSRDTLKLAGFMLAAAVLIAVASRLFP